MRSGKRKITEGIELPNQEMIRTLGEKENYEYLEKLEVDTIKPVEMKEKIEKRVFQTNQKIFRKQILQHISQQTDKQQGCFCCKTLGTLLEMDKGRASAVGPENKKTYDDA